MMSDVRSLVQSQLTRQGVKDSRVLVAVSGGVDSMTLLDVVTSLRDEMGLDVHVAHVDHALRIDSADDSRAIVQEMQRRGVTLHTARLDVPAATADSETGIEATARRVRYEYLTQTAESIGAAFVMTGHTVDDVVETVLMNIARAGSLHALAGIPASRPLSQQVQVVRPLIECRREDILQYARDRGLLWREDPSNSESRFLRNRVRHELLPVLKSVFGPGITRNVLRMAGTMGELAMMVDQMAAAAQESLLRIDPSQAIVDLGCFAKFPRVVTDTVLRRELHMNTVDRDRLHGLIDTEVGTRASLSGGRQAVRDRHNIVVYLVEPSLPPAEEFEISLSEERTAVPYRAGDSMLFVSPSENHSRRSDRPTRSVAIDLDQVSGPLRCRPWRSGDKIILKGASGSKLVSDVLTDAKIPHSIRRQVHVVADDEGILWVCGIRQSHRAQFTEDTVRYLLCWVRPDVVP